MYRNVYPRPSFVRENWLNLNGQWDFEITDGKDKDYLAPDVQLDSKIEVPFCPESKLSGIGNRDFMKNVWYRRTVDVSADQLQGSVVINFGAVDYECTLYVNGKKAGYHKGGYVSFSFDITEYLAEGENVLLLGVYDDTRSICQPTGKQSNRPDSYGCHYTRTTGIWQTVWLEFMGKAYITERKITADVNSKSILFEGCVNDKTGDVTVCADVSYKGEKVLSCETVTRNGKFKMTASTEAELHLWDVFKPEIYDIVLIVKKDGEVCDSVKTYTGFRTVDLRDGKFLLNGKSVFLRQILDQGFHPDGIYTFPAIEEIEKDIDLAIDFGFNGARPHEKVFEDYYLYYADMKGYLIWGEFPNWGCCLDTKNNPQALKNFLPEWKEELVRDYNHPSIIGWCPLNECWHGFVYCDAKAQKAIYSATKEYDKTRPVIGASGGFHYITDIDDYHDYSHTAEEIIAHVYNHKNGTKDEKQIAVLNKTKKSGILTQKELKGLPIFCSEYGGISYKNDKENSWGYVAEDTEDAFVAHYISDTTAIMQSDCMGMCYTQLTDVEQEQNGLVDYHRNHKLSENGIKAIRECNLQKAKVEND
ncbi:MAG: beta-galactosidase [Clostridia bacterium]|nr:beta-galactosidase [Clostridia bacterium]